jgi:hypothetical protein
MTVAEAQGRMTTREAWAWQHHIRAEEERPSRADWYTMQVAHEVRRSIHAAAGRAYRGRLGDFVLKPDTPKPIDPVTATANAKAVWAARLGRNLDV